MIFSFVFVFLFLLACTGILFFFFGFFVPALKLRYDGIDELLSSEEYLNKEEIQIKQKKLKEAEEFSKACEDASIAVYASITSGVVNEDKNFLERRFIYKGEKNCRLFYNNYASEYKDIDCCIGFGDCQNVCPQDSIYVQNGIAKITTSCNGCGKCIEICPANLIALTSEKPNFEDKGFKFWKSCYRIFSRKC